MFEELVKEVLKKFEGQEGNFEVCLKEWFDENESSIISYSVNKNQQNVLVVVQNIDPTMSTEKHNYTVYRMFPGGKGHWYLSVDLQDGSVSDLTNILLKKII